MTHAGGRPTEYKEEYIDAVDEYLSICKDEEKDNGKLKVSLPTIEGFAMFIDVSKRILYNWEQLHPQFLHALDKIRTEQQKRLLDKGLSGDYNSTIAKLILSSNHGMREKSDITTNDKDLPTPIMEIKRDVLTNNSDQEDSVLNKED